MKKVTLDKENVRAYVMLQTICNSERQDLRILHRQPGVVLVDEVEGPFDVIFAIQAADREKLADSMLRVISTVEPVTLDFQIIPSKLRND
jgi:hypothetical protein